MCQPFRHDEQCVQAHGVCTKYPFIHLCSISRVTREGITFARRIAGRTKFSISSSFQVETTVTHGYLTSVSMPVLKNTLRFNVAWIERVRLCYSPTDFDFIEHRLKYRPFVYEGHAALLCCLFLGSNRRWVHVRPLAFLSAFFWTFQE
jgi:hypothetical protein